MNRAGRQLLCLATLFGAVAAVSLAGRAGAQMLDRRWARPAPNCATYSIAPDGTVVVSSDWDGTLVSHGMNGEELWRARLPGPVSVALSNAGGLCVAAMQDGRHAGELIFLDALGRKVRTEKTPGPVLSAAVSVSGRTVVALTEPGRLTVYRKEGKRWRWKRIALAGPATSIAINARGTRIALARRDPGGVDLYDRELRRLWSWRGAPNRRYKVQIDHDGGTVAALELPEPGGVPVILAWDARRPVPAWRHTLNGDLPHISLSPDGRYLAADYRTRIFHRQNSRVEARVTFFSGNGHDLWEVGGLMFGAHLIGATGPPYLVITHDNSRVLAAMDPLGHMRARHRLITPVQSTAMSADGTAFAVLTDAKLLYLFRARR